MVHDQVLHTLALIQRRATDSTTVLGWPAGRSGSLRSWLAKADDVSGGAVRGRARAGRG
jgi:hypothetical protein